MVVACSGGGGGSGSGGRGDGGGGTVMHTKVSLIIIKIEIDNLFGIQMINFVM